MPVSGGGTAVAKLAGCGLTLTKAGNSTSCRYRFGVAPGIRTSLLVVAEDNRMPDIRDSHDEKAVALYSIALESWVSTRMEKDRTLLSLAGGGVGLLVTLLTMVGPSSRCELGLYVAAGTCSAGTILVAQLVFDRNSCYLEEVIRSGKTADVFARAHDIVSETTLTASKVTRAMVHSSAGGLCHC